MDTTQPCCDLHNPIVCESDEPGMDGPCCESCPSRPRYSDHASYQASEHGSERVSTYRDRLAEAIVAATPVLRDHHGRPKQSAVRVLDAVLAVRDAELDALREAARGNFSDLMIKLLRAEEYAERAETELSEAKKKIEDLSSFLTPLVPFLELVAAIQHSAKDRETLTADIERVKAILDNPPPGDTPEPNRRRLLRELTQEAIESGTYGEPAPGDMR